LPSQQVQQAQLHPSCLLLQLNAVLLCKCSVKMAWYSCRFVSAQNFLDHVRLNCITTVQLDTIKL
jgi:hypothetical protein